MCGELLRYPFHFSLSCLFGPPTAYQLSLPSCRRISGGGAEQGRHEPAPAHRRPIRVRTAGRLQPGQPAPVYEREAGKRT